MPTSHCFNCGNPKNPPFIQHYCDDCEVARMKARQSAIEKGESPDLAGRAALESRAFNPKTNRPNPRAPYTTYDVTQNVLRSRDLPPELS